MSEEDRASGTDEMYRKFGEIWTCGFYDTRADKQIKRNMQTTP